MFYALLSLASVPIAEKPSVHDSGSVHDAVKQGDSVNMTEPSNLRFLLYNTPNVFYCCQSGKTKRIKIMKDRSINAKELKTLTNQSSLPRAITAIAIRMQKRTWKLAGKLVEWSGINWEKDFVLFSLIESAGENSASYRYWRVAIEDAMDCITGNLDGLQTLERRA